MISKIISMFTSEMAAWLTWILIPVVVEIIPSVGTYIVLIRKFFRKDKRRLIEKLPDITLIIPVYNSSESLGTCISSIANSTYPNELIEVMLVDNMSRDNSFEIYQECQMYYPDLKMQWMRSKQGKSKALNLALFNSNGKYIVNIDSDGMLEEHALENLVKKFENNEDIHCMTGVILTNPELIKKTKNPALKFLQKMEYLEYCHSFMAGRNYESESNNIFSLSGAFSAFRKSTILKTQMYNTSTLCEDAHLTLQVKKNLNQRVALCEDAIFITDPVESFGKLYTQRQRWQIGELEVLHMFFDKKNLHARQFFTDGTVRMLMYDHTFAFPRMIWYFALIALGITQYDMGTIGIAVGMIYILYVLVSFLYMGAIVLYMRDFDEMRRQYIRKSPLLIFLPLYNLYVYFIRFAGILNCINRKSSWNTSAFKDECRAFAAQVKKDFTLQSFREKQIGKKAAFSVLFGIILIINAGLLFYFLQNNRENKITNYELNQSQTLYAISQQINGGEMKNIKSVVDNNKISKEQRYCLYNTKENYYSYYMDETEGYIVDDKISRNIINNSSKSVEVTDENGKDYIISTNMAMISGIKYIIAAVTPVSYISGITGDGSYDKYIMTELCILYIFILGFYFNYLDNDRIYEEKINKLNKEFDEYKLHSDNTVEDQDIKNPDNKDVAAFENKEENETKEQNFVTDKGIYNSVFREKLINKLKNENIKYNEYNAAVTREDGEKLVTLLKETDAIVVDYEDSYRIIFINKERSECDRILSMIGEKMMKKSKAGVVQ